MEDVTSKLREIGFKKAKKETFIGKDMIKIEDGMYLTLKDGKTGDKPVYTLSKFMIVKKSIDGLDVVEAVNEIDLIEQIKEDIESVKAIVYNGEIFTK